METNLLGIYVQPGNNKCFLNLFLFFVSLFIENVEEILILKTHIEHRNGKDYITINNVSPGSNTVVNFSHGEINFEYENAHPVVNGIINHMANANFKSFKVLMDPFLDKYFGDTTEPIFKPIFDGMAIQDLYCME